MLILSLTAGILVLFALNSPLVTSKSDVIVGNNCRKELQKLADSISNFTRCAVMEASPFTFCRMCGEQFDEVRNAKNIFDKKDGCVGPALVESERYQIVSNVYAFATNLWKQSNCFSCFPPIHRDIESIGTKWELKTEVKDFFHKQEIVDLCFKNHTRVPGNPVANMSSSNTSMLTNLTIDMHSICHLCEPYYKDLKDVYKHLIIEVGGFENENSLCADVMSAMNSTRHQWSSKFDCIQISYDTASVVALTCFFGFLPIIFYSAAKLHGDSNNKKSSYDTIPRINYDTE